MLVRALSMIRGRHGAANPGQELDVPAEVAAAWCASGVAEAMGPETADRGPGTAPPDQTATVMTPPESATIAPPETGMRPRPRPHRRTTPLPEPALSRAEGVPGPRSAVPAEPEA